MNVLQRSRPWRNERHPVNDSFPLGTRTRTAHPQIAPPVAPTRPSSDASQPVFPFLSAISPASSSRSRPAAPRKMQSRGRLSAAAPRLGRTLPPVARVRQKRTQNLVFLGFTPVWPACLPSVSLFPAVDHRAQHERPHRHHTLTETVKPHKTTTKIEARCRRRRRAARVGGRVVRERQRGRRRPCRHQH